MTFLWPAGLLSLLLIPLGAAIWLFSAHRRRARAATVAGFRLTGPVRRPGRGWLVASLFLCGFVLVCIGIARPQAVLAVSREEGTVILAFDVSASMSADDVSPTRMDAAKETAREFIAARPSNVAVGIVSFTDLGASVQLPTTDSSALEFVLDQLTPQQGTSIGRGIQAAIGAIDASVRGPDGGYAATPSGDASQSPPPDAGAGAAVIVLISDGENNESPDPTSIAQIAAAQGIRVDTVGIGTAAGTTIEVGGYKVHTQLDADQLQQIAAATGGTYTTAMSADDLRQVYANVRTNLLVSSQPIEATSLVAALSLAVLGLASGLSYAWLGRLP
jgi:Ca-activated chloride channel family protein